MDGLDLKVYFCGDWGTRSYFDPDFRATVQWDIPLLEGYRSEFLPVSRRPKRFRYWEVDNSGVARVLDEFDPDVVQVCGYAHRTNWRVAAWARRRGTPLLLYSDSNAAAPTPWWKRLPKRLIVGRFYAHVDGALYVGENNLAYHLRYGLPRGRLFRGVLPVDVRQLLSNCPDPEAARRAVRARYGIPAEAFVVMSCGKLVPWKRPQDLVIAAGAAWRKGLPIWALLVGEGPERKHVERLVRREGLDNVVLAGFVNQSRIGEYYAAADVAAVTSSKEPWGLVVTESAAFGRPVVVSDRVGCIGASDPARPGVNAIIYPCENWPRLQEAIETLYRDKALYARMAESARLISHEQGVAVAAELLCAGVRDLHRLGPRRGNGVR